MRNVFRTNVPLRPLVGCSIGGGIMIIGGVLELLLGVVAEGRELEQVTGPQTAVTATLIPAASDEAIASVAARAHEAGRRGHGDPDPASAKCPGHPARRAPTAARIRGRLTGRYHL